MLAYYKLGLITMMVWEKLLVFPLIGTLHLSFPLVLAQKIAEHTQGSLTVLSDSLAL